jgi:ribosomal protein L10
VPKKRKETKLERRVTAIEAKLIGIEKILKDAKLDEIEKLLQEVLSVTKAMAKP